MIRLSQVGHTYRIGQERDLVFRDVTIDIPSDRRIAILGNEQSGKTTLIRLLAGLQSPTEGSIERFCRVSFPCGFIRGLKPNNSLRQNLDFAARVYGADSREVADFVARVFDRPELMDEPVKRLSVQARVSFGYAMTYAIPFDTYLFDNGIAYGTTAFRQRCLAMFEARAATCGMLVATSQARVAERLCESALVIDDGALSYFDDVREAIDMFESVSGKVTELKGLEEMDMLVDD